MTENKVEARPDEQGYNGWKNYETWAVALWLDNDESTYREVRAIAAECQADCAERLAKPREEYGDPWGESSFVRSVPNLFAESLKDFVDNDMPDLGASMWADLLGAAFSEVDWHEIATNILSESD